MQITNKGQVTIPLAFREFLGFFPHTEVEFSVDGNNRLYLEKKKTKKTKRGASLIQSLRGKASVKMSTDEILALTRGNQ